MEVSHMERNELLKYLVWLVVYDWFLDVQKNWVAKDDVIPRLIRRFHLCESLPEFDNVFIERTQMHPKIIWPELTRRALDHIHALGLQQCKQIAEESTASYQAIGANAIRQNIRRLITALDERAGRTQEQHKLIVFPQESGNRKELPPQVEQPGKPQKPQHREQRPRIPQQLLLWKSHKVR